MLKRMLNAAPMLRASIVAKEQEFLRAACDLKGRQALLMVRNHWRESRSDREHTDRRKIDATKMRGENLDGSWNAMNLVLSDVDPANMPSDSYLLDHSLTELRPCKRFAVQMNTRRSA